VAASVDPEEETKEAPKTTADSKPDNWRQSEAELVLDQLGLKGVIDPEHHTGVVVSKCCHYFHYECLLSYLTAETTQQSFAQVRMRSVVGIDHGEIQCPFCKGLKNTWFPVLPLRPASADMSQQARRIELDLFVAFFNQLI